MVGGAIVSLVAAVSMSATMATATFEAEPQWVDVGEYRISEYCIFCNDGGSNESSSGVPLEYGHAASQDFPIGTEVMVDGETYVITDICGVPGTIDIFVDDYSDGCHCNRLDYKEVYVKNGV